jgi:hypothetical protein
MITSQQHNDLPTDGDIMTMSSQDNHPAAVDKLSMTIVLLNLVYK